MTIPCLGLSRPVSACPGQARPSEAWLVRARHGVGSVRNHRSESGEAQRGEAGYGAARPGRARHGGARQGAGNTNKRGIG